jgi:acetyltransferase-like isoleucine patch superfamily enzyme
MSEVWLDRVLLRRWRRRLELWRGRWLCLRGARAGRRFGIGRGVTVEHPHCLHAGDDVTICEYSYLHCLSERGVRIGSHTSVDRNLWLHCGGKPDDHAHGYFEIGERSSIGCNAVMGAGGGIRIGNYVLIGQCVNFHAESHVFEDGTRLIREQGVRYQGIVIEDDVWIGSKATILDGVTVGRGAVVGAGAVVTRSIEPFAIAAGVPARVVGFRGLRSEAE